MKNKKWIDNYYFIYTGNAYYEIFENPDLDFVKVHFDLDLYKPDVDLNGTADWLKRCEYCHQVSNYWISETIKHYLIPRLD